MFRDAINRKIIIWTTVLGGFVGAFVKWGSEVNMPPRVAGEVSPPGANIDAWVGWLGLDHHSLDYIWQGNNVLGFVTLYHISFCIIFAFVYVAGSYYCNKYVRMWRGALYGIVIMLVMHGLVIPLLGFRDPAYDPAGTVGWLWNLNGYELWSEFLGHIYWAVSIEICMVAVLAYYSRPITGVWKNSK